MRNFHPLDMLEVVGRVNETQLPSGTCSADHSIQILYFPYFEA